MLYCSSVREARQENKDTGVSGGAAQVMASSRELQLAVGEAQSKVGA